VSDLTPEQIQVLEEEGLGPRRVIRYVKELLDADPARVIQVDEDGNFRLKRRIPRKHLRAVTEIARGKIKFVDRVAALRLAAEMAKQIGGKRQDEKREAQTFPIREAVFLMPGEKPAQVLSIESAGAAPEIYIATHDRGNGGND